MYVNAIHPENTCLYMLCTYEHMQYLLYLPLYHHNTHTALFTTTHRQLCSPQHTDSSVHHNTQLCSPHYTALFTMTTPCASLGLLSASSTMIFESSRCSSKPSPLVCGTPSSLRGGPPLHPLLLQGKGLQWSEWGGSLAGPACRTVPPGQVRGGEGEGGREGGEAGVAREVEGEKRKEEGRRSRGQWEDGGGRREAEEGR